MLYWEKALKTKNLIVGRFRRDYFSFIPAGSLLEESVVVEEDPDVVEDLVELAGGAVQDEVGGDPDLQKAKR